MHSPISRCAQGYLWCIRQLACLLIVKSFLCRYCKYVLGMERFQQLVTPNLQVNCPALSRDFQAAETDVAKISSIFPINQPEVQMTQVRIQSRNKFQDHYLEAMLTQDYSVGMSRKINGIHCPARIPHHLSLSPGSNLANLKY